MVKKVKPKIRRDVALEEIRIATEMLRLLQLKKFQSDFRYLKLKNVEKRNSLISVRAAMEPQEFTGCRFLKSFQPQGI